ncbi:hypothetical protein [Aquamicrobium defluvii]|uniref:Uncharacterized protein n=1 Tax=Aquamicrobium defluvii TaxID=69279 RepID=A0A011T068_9HYPH|nr:hypothetical protein [Aquamicrobium defluvii]EXL04974.1 hypothetical protein BG36_09545 [Aquamicrobium defluvii]EZQ14617.1 hypothetical protein CF98_18940 [Halopseudomonas bauzanensis]
MTHTSLGGTESINRLVNPKSIATVGASAGVGKVNDRPLKHLIGSGQAGKLMPAGRSEAAFAGRQTKH